MALLGQLEQSARAGALATWVPPDGGGLSLAAGKPLPVGFFVTKLSTFFVDKNVGGPTFFVDKIIVDKNVEWADIFFVDKFCRL